MHECICVRLPSCGSPRLFRLPSFYIIINNDASSSFNLRVLKGFARARRNGPNCAESRGLLSPGKIPMSFKIRRVARDESRRGAKAATRETPHDGPMRPLLEER